MHAALIVCLGDRLKGVFVCVSSSLEVSLLSAICFGLCGVGLMECSKIMLYCWFGGCLVGFLWLCGIFFFFFLFLFVFLFGGCWSFCEGVGEGGEFWGGGGVCGGWGGGEVFGGGFIISFGVGVVGEGRDVQVCGGWEGGL